MLFLTLSSFLIHQDIDDTRRGLKRKPPDMDRGHEHGSYNMNSRPYDRNMPPDGVSCLSVFYFIV